MNKKSILTYAMIAGGAYALYWYVTNYGPAGKITDANGNAIPGATSWWASWFGASAAAAPGAGAGTGAPASTTTSAPAPVQTCALTIPPGLSVTPDVNNSLRGTVNCNGTPIMVNVIMPNGGVYNAQGHDITSMFTAAQLQQLIQAFQAAQTPVGNPTSTGAASSGLARPDQISQIQALLLTKDLPAFQQMVAAGLTSAQADQMLGVASGCTAVNTAASINPLFQTPKLGLTIAGGQPGTCAPVGVSGMGDITPAPAARQSTASPTPGASPRSPWGRIAAVDAGGMNYKN